MMASPAKKTSPALVTVTDAGSGTGISELQLTIRFDGQVRAGSGMRLRVAQFVVLLQKPAISTQYCPMVSAVAFVIVMELVVAQSSNTPSFLQMKVNGP
jgi:hypothetical protein